MSRAEGVLIQRVLDGEVDVFARLVTPHDSSIRGAVYNVVLDRSLVDDVVQDSYLRAFQRLGQYRGEAPFKAWLHGIAYRAAIDCLRRRRPMLPIDDEPLKDTARGPESHAVTTDLVARALAVLDPEQRAVIVLVDQLGMSYDDTAAALGIATGTVGSRVHRARARMRQALADPPSLPPPASADTDPAGGPR